MWAVRALAASCIASGSSLTLSAASSLRHQTIRAASSVSHVKFSSERKADGIPDFASRKARSSKTATSAKPTSRPSASHGSDDKDAGAARKSFKGKEKTMNSSTFARKRIKARGVAKSGQRDQPDDQRGERKHEKEAGHQSAPSIEGDKPDEIDSTSPATEEAQIKDELASAQDILRSYFSRPKSKAVDSASSSAETGSISALDRNHYGDEDDRGLDDSPSAQELDQDPASSLDTATNASSPPQFSRPTLAEIQKADTDQFAGLYKSPTAWDPSKDYALMQDGPVRESFLKASLIKGPQPYIVVILDGDNLLFDPRHLTQGYDGGKFVYNELRQRIARKHQLIPERLDLRIRMFCSKTALADMLHTGRIVSRLVFFDFLQGLIDGNLCSYIVNVGRGDQAADLRVKAALADALMDQRCFRAYLGGLDDYGYKEELGAISEAGLLETKVHLVQVPGYATESNVYRQYAHRAIGFDYIFKSNRAVFRNMEKYNHEAYVASTTPDNTNTHTIPCTFFHLGKNGCVLGDACEFSHAPISESAKGRIRATFKQRTCPTIKRGEECQFGDGCLFA
ncbi:conserved hypothetical protein [Sporisorium reilianum SRZ2]|uniref:C3H1-type domain-containing protein n=1 Tax=Sporisorium reilianum (strain SRZ2) TaxID=999809 RepID=E6ZXK5_SPORE|nr:conserved hypothetical protein [Sporisorium reilianum SRZ2]